MVLHYKEYLQKIDLIWNPRISNEAMRDPTADIRNNRFNRNIIITSLAINILSLGLPILSLQIYDRILVSQNLSTLSLLVCGVLVAIILEGILRLARSYVVNWASAVYEHIIACNAMRHMLSADLTALENEDVSEQLQRMNNVAKLREFTSGQALITFLDLPFIGLYMALMAYLAGSLVLAPIVVVIIFSFFITQLGTQIQNQLNAREAADERRFGFMIQTLNGINTVKSLGMENGFLRRYELFQHDTSIANFHIAKSSARTSTYGILFNQGMIILTVLVGTPMVIAGKITMGTLIACVLLTGRVMSPLQKALGFWVRFQDAKLAVAAVRKIFELPQLATEITGADTPRDGSLKLNNVSFAYGAKDLNILSDISLELNRGDCISISGEHSCGKTTLLKIIAGLYQPSNGQVIIDNMEATRYSANNIIKRVGYLEMEGAIFKGSIQENLSAFGQIDSQQVKEITKLLNIDKEIIKLPEGFDTLLDGGSSDPIPPGLKQRIAIARTLASKPRILLFDNADRSLDAEGYHQLYKLLGKIKNKIALIIVTDDRNILQLADKEYLLSNGKLVTKNLSDSSKAFDIKPSRLLDI